jgi:N-acetylglucosamine malate deacetylase 2
MVVERRQKASATSTSRLRQGAGKDEEKLQSAHILARATAPESNGEQPVRALIVVAHPDDEVVALGGRLGRLGASHLVHVTDGAPRDAKDSHAYGFASLEHYRDARETELRKALDLAGISGVSRTRIGIFDQESFLHLIELTNRIEELIADQQPEAIFTHPYEGGHPDHDACAFAVHHAVELRKSKGHSVPAIIEATFYHAAGSAMETGRFLASAEMPEITYKLTKKERSQKRALLACFTTQQGTLRCFETDDESYRIAPQYDFRKLPHEAPLLYDHYSWGADSERFKEEAERAIRSLAISGLHGR